MIAQDSLTTLEFHKILERLSSYASFSAGKAQVAGLEPLTEMAPIEHLLSQVSESRMLLDTRPSITLGGARDVREPARRAAIGAVLRGEELLAIAGTLESCRDLKTVIGRVELEIPWIRSIMTSLNSYPDVIGRINRSLDQDGEVLDAASPKLRSLRSEIRAAHGRVLERLNSMIASPEYRSALQEPIVTMRNGRYVIPVRSDSRSKVPGIVHDQSATGHTSFVEPTAVTELNNRWTELQIAEHREVERILEELSRSVGVVGEGIVTTVDGLATLDCAFARAKYAEAITASRPKLNSGGYLNLIEARHPLLTGQVVPLSLNLGGDFSVLVITGPNTGGKTVALKTVGLLTLMAQSGLHIPAAEGSEISVFSQIWADIGDEQSIEQSLSTFSSHMRNIVEILRQTDGQSLVLLDELGAGTDPAEGSGLARAIIRELLDRGARAVVTTHFSELKSFAYDQEGVENASVEFDVRTLSPTYRLTIGVPGRSQALAIAKRLGLPPDIIERARSFLSRGGVRVEKLLSQIQQERRAIGNLYERAKELNEDLAKLRGRVQEEVETTRREREKILDASREEGAQALIAFRKRLQELESSASSGASRERVAGVRSIREQAEKARRELIPSSESPTAPRSKAPEAMSGVIETGDQVRVLSLDQQGTVTSAVGDGFEVQVGNFKMRLPKDDVELLSKQSGTSRKSKVSVATKSVTPSMEIDIRGKRPSEVEPELERYINDGYMSGMNTLRVIHGHGTGALRRAIREQLQAHPLVSGLAPGNKEQGGEGVTIVTLSS